MSKQALQVALCAAAVAFALIFALPAFKPLPVFWYYPLQHRWAFELKPTALAMDWYGRTALASATALVAFALTALVGRRWTPSARALGLWAAWVATACAIAMSLYVFQLAQRVPTPAPLPSWYQPR